MLIEKIIVFNSLLAAKLRSIAVGAARNGANGSSNPSCPLSTQFRLRPEESGCLSRIAPPWKASKYWLPCTANPPRSSRPRRWVSWPSWSVAAAIGAATAGRACGAATADRRRRIARLSAGDGRRSQRRVAHRAGAGRPARSTRRDHRTRGSQDGDQRAQLRREDVHGRFRGFARADLGTPRSRGRSICATRSSGTIEYTSPARQALHARQTRGHAAGAAARLASGREARVGRRPADLGQHFRFRAVLLSQRAGAGGQRHWPLLLSAQAGKPPGSPAVERRVPGGAGQRWAFRAERSRPRC